MMLWLTFINHRCSSSSTIIDKSLFIIIIMMPIICHHGTPRLTFGTTKRGAAVAAQAALPPLKRCGPQLCTQRFSGEIAFVFWQKNKFEKDDNHFVWVDSIGWHKQILLTRLRIGKWWLNQRMAVGSSWDVCNCPEFRNCVFLGNTPSYQLSNPLGRHAPRIWKQQPEGTFETEVSAWIATIPTVSDKSIT